MAFGILIFANLIFTIFAISKKKIAKLKSREKRLPRKLATQILMPFLFNLNMRLNDNNVSKALDLYVFIP